jgi:hypothetical protein
MEYLTIHEGGDMQRAYTDLGEGGSIMLAAYMPKCK